jgi:excisionase family DNA binding protein
MDNKDTPRPPALLTVREVADMLRVHQRTAYRLIISGSIKAIKIGSQWRVTEPALMEFIEEGWKASATGQDVTEKATPEKKDADPGPEQLKLPLD